MTSQLIRRRSAGFTLVELLTVILIIGILTSLITAAAYNVRLAALRAAMRTEINQLEMGLNSYKDQMGDFPPDFFGVDRSDAAGVAARAEVVRHLRKAFPNYRPGSVSGSTNVDAFRRFIDDLTSLGYLPAIPANFSGLDAYLNPATALPFWLGGMPADVGTDSSTKLMGFAANPKNPFDNNPSASRKEKFYDFNETQLICVQKSADEDNYPFFHYLPARTETPFVYFKARRNPNSGKPEYALSGSTALIPAYFQMSKILDNPAGGTNDVASPYLQNAWQSGNRNAFEGSPSHPTNHIRKWHKPKSFQIICAGLDGIYGEDASPGSSFRFSPAEEPENLAAGWGITDGDYDNLTNFLPGQIEDEMP